MADTRRDIIGRVKTGGQDVTNTIQALNGLYKLDPTVASSAQKAIVDSVNASVAALTASMAAYAAATP